MAVTPTTLADINNLAKDYFSNVYIQAQNTEVPLKAQFATLQNAQFTGRKWIFGVKMAVGGGAANAGANFSLPPASQGQYEQGEATLARTYTRMALDNMAIEVTKQQQGSYRPALAETMSDRLEAHDFEVNRQLYCPGDGTLTTIGAGVASATQTLGSDYGVVNGGLGVRHITEGDMVAIYSAGFGVKRGTYTVVARDKANNQMTLDSSATTTTGDIVVKATADTDNHVAGEAFGLLMSVQSSGAAFETIPSTGRWTSQVDANAGTLRDLTDPMVLQAIAEIKASSRKVPNLAVTRSGVVLKYSEQFLPLRRIMGQDIELKGGFKPLTALQYAGGAIPVLEDLDAPNSRLFLINTEAFRMADLIGTGWFDGDGAQFLRVTDKDSIEGYIRKYWQLITVQRNANGMIADLNDISTIER